MARSPLTLAASVTSALPGAVVVGVSPLSERATGSYDAALVEIDDGSHVVVRVPNDDAAAARLTDELRSLEALTAGVRELLPFHAPRVLGHTALGGTRAAVVTHLPGYRVEAAHVPSGRGLAPSLGRSIAAVHSLPTSVVRSAGLPARTTQQVRAEVSRLLDRADATDRVPVSLTARWRRAVADDALWRFETTVTLGGVTSASFLVEDLDEVPTVTGALEWHGLGVGDPALDLQWIVAAPDAADDVYAAYASEISRALDGMLRARTRLYAELEFAQWLVHGHDVGSDEILTDAEELLRSLAESTGGDDIASEEASDVDSALATMANLPAASTGVDTSMQTDAYDADELAHWISDDATDEMDDAIGAEGESEAAPMAEAGTEPPRHASTEVPVQSHAAGTDVEHATEPIDVDGLAEAIESGRDAVEAERASDAALRRWLAE